MRQPPSPPPGPPNRAFKETFFGGLVETKESKQRTRDYENFMKGWSAAAGVSPTKFRPHPVEYVNDMKSHECNSCIKGYDGTNGNGYQPCSCGGK